MARLARLCVPGEVHFVIQRGHNRQPVFVDDADRRQFLDALREAAIEHRMQVHAYALLDDRVEMLVTPAGAEGLSKGMQAVGRRYVAGFNRRHGRSGTLWEGRFRAAVIEGKRYMVPAMMLIESAPVVAGLVSAPEAWTWSSASHHLGGRRDPLVVDHPVYWGLGNTPFDREASYRRLLESGVSQADLRALTEAGLKSWALGSSAFLAALSERTSRPLVVRRRGRPRKSSDASPINPVAAASDD
jgi:putative transposase